MKSVITDVRIKRTLDDILESRVEIALWDYKDGIFSNPRWETISIDYKLKSRDTNFKDKLDVNYNKLIADYKNVVLSTLRDKYKIVKSRLAKTGLKNKQRVILEKRLAIITKVGQNIHDYVKLDSDERTSDIKTPPFTNLINGYLLDGFYNMGFSKFAKKTLGFPFGIIENGVYTGKKVNISDLLNAKSVALDFETKNWEQIYLDDLEYLSEAEIKAKLFREANKFNEPITFGMFRWLNKKTALHKLSILMNKYKGEAITIEIDSLTNDDFIKNCLFTTFNYDDPIVHNDIFSEVITAKDQFDLIKKGNEFYKKEQPFFVTGYNVLGFDIPKADDLTKVFKRGICGEKSKFVNKPKFGALYEIPGRSVIDAFPYLRSYEIMHRNKMDDAHKLLCGGGDNKIISHDQITELTKQAEESDENSARTLLEYALQDGIKTTDICGAVMEEIILGAMIHNISTASFAFKSRKNKSKEYWDNFNQINLWNQVFINNKKLGYDDFVYQDEINKQLGFKSRTFKVKKGIHDAYLVSIHPLISSFGSLLKKDSDLLRTIWLSEKDPRRKLRLSNLIEDLLIYPFFRSLGDSGHDQYWQDFGCDKTFYSQQFKENIDLLKKSLEGKVINYSGSLVLLSEPAYFPLNFPSINIAEGTFVSGNKGTFIGEGIMKGISDFQSNKGTKTFFEKCFYETFFDLVFKSRDDAYIFAHDSVVMLKDGELDHTLYWEKVARRNFYEYSAVAKQEHIREMIKQNVLKDQKYSKVYSHEEAFKKFFGKNGSISKVLNWFYTKEELKPIYNMINNNFD